MKLLITLVIVGVFCTIASNAFLFKHKFKDGCDPNPCEHKAKCVLNAKNANISTCEVTLFKLINKIEQKYLIH